MEEMFFWGPHPQGHQPELSCPNGHVNILGEDGNWGGL